MIELNDVPIELLTDLFYRQNIEKAKEVKNYLKKIIFKTIDYTY